MDINTMATKARKAAFDLSLSSVESRNEALQCMINQLQADKAAIFEANRKDLEAATDLSAPLKHRLIFGEEKLQQVCDGLSSLIKLPDPINKTLEARELTEGLKLYKTTCPIGVIGVIFESRPDALVQIASLALKSGNAVLLKGGREALQTNSALSESLRKAVEKAGLPADFAQLMETREDVSAMLKEDQLIDLIIPRGSNAFVRYIMENSSIPVLGHADGLCHVFVDEDAELDMALNIAEDSKTQNVSVCNAMETLLVQQKIAADFLPPFYARMVQKQVQLCGDEQVRKYIPVDEATEEDWATEYLDYKLSIKIVQDVDEAIAHINHYGSHHTDCIVTSNDAHAAKFMDGVDSAGVYRNVSTRFADGFVYGLGAEVGIATGKIHARGPMGLEGLTTYKYKLFGSGQLMAEMKSGKRHYTHVELNEDCPLK